MSDEVVVDAPPAGEVLESPDAAPETTAVAEGDAVSPEAPAPKTFTQEELDAVLGKRLAIEKRKYDRMIAAANPPKVVEVKPFDQYESPEAYAKDVADAAIAGAKVHEAHTAETSTFAAAVEKAVEKYPDFEDVAFTHPFMTDDMAKVIRVSPVSTELAYHLGKNLEEAERISSLSPVQQIRELVKLEAKLEAVPAKVAVSKAPAPIKPVGGGGATKDTADLSKASMDEYREARKKQGATWAR